MEALFVLVASFGLLWVLFIWPRQRQVRAHQQLVASLEVGDDVILTAGIFGRIVAMRPDEVSVAVAPGVDLRVARQAVLRRVEPAGDTADDADVADAADVGDGAVADHAVAGDTADVADDTVAGDTADADEGTAGDGDMADPPGPDTDPPASELR